MEKITSVVDIANELDKIKRFNDLMFDAMQYSDSSEKSRQGTAWLLISINETLEEITDFLDKNYLGRLESEKTA